MINWFFYSGKTFESCDSVNYHGIDARRRVISFLLYYMKLFLNPSILEYNLCEVGFLDELHSFGGEWHRVFYDDDECFFSEEDNTESEIGNNVADVIIINVSNSFVFESDLIYEIDRVLKPNGIVIVIQSISHDPVVARLCDGYYVDEVELHSQDEGYSLVDESGYEEIEYFDCSNFNMSEFREFISKCSAPSVLHRNLYDQMVDQLIEGAYYENNKIGVNWQMKIRVFKKNNGRTYIM